MNHTAWTLTPSPVGEVLVATTGTAISILGFLEDGADGVPVNPAAGGRFGPRDDKHPVLVEAAEQLRGYFDGTVSEFQLPLDPTGTDFQREVWDALRDIDYGETRSYGQVAASIGRSPAASRAVGVANGRNPIAIVVPCHRVVGADGTLVGYAGGLSRKRFLLGLERQHVAGAAGAGSDGSDVLF